MTQYTSRVFFQQKKPKQAERTWNTFAIIALFCAPIFISLLERTDSIYPDFFYPLAVCQRCVEPELAQSGPEFGAFQKSRARLRLRSITTVGISSEARGGDTFLLGTYSLISRIDMYHVGNSVFFNNQWTIFICQKNSLKELNYSNFLKRLRIQYYGI